MKASGLHSTCGRQGRERSSSIWNLPLSCPRARKPTWRVLPQQRRPQGTQPPRHQPLLLPLPMTVGELRGSRLARRAAAHRWPRLRRPLPASLHRQYIFPASRVLQRPQLPHRPTVPAWSQAARPRRWWPWPPCWPACWCLLWGPPSGCWSGTFSSVWLSNIS